MEKLKIGLLINTNVIPAWASLMIEQIITSNHSEISLIIKNDFVSKKESFFERLKRSYKVLLFSAYTRMDKKIFKTTTNAFEDVDMTSTFIKIDTIHVLPVFTKLIDRISEEDIVQINSYNLDVIIRLGFKILKGEILKTAKFGIWSFHHGDNKTNRGGPAGVWEVIQSRIETGVILQILTEDLDAGTIIERSYSGTYHLGINRNNNNSYWKSLSMVSRNLERLYKNGGEQFFSKIYKQNENPFFYHERLYKTPTNIELSGLLIMKIIFKLKEKIIGFIFIDQWILMFQISASIKISDTFYKFKKIIPPKDRFWADPFVIFKDDLYYIFFEELIYSTNKGHICLLTIDKKGNVSDSIKVLEKNYHLSYPFVFESNNEYFMIPESSENKSIELYKSANFPYEWELVMTLKENVSAVDTTIHFHDNKYWMFCNIKQNKGASSLDELYIFYADDFKTTNWNAHPQNPVVSDVKKARPAGKIFQYNGNYYRPSQNCSKYYGWGMNISKIITLTETEYIEENVQQIFSLWDKKLVGTHTLNHDSKLTIIDGQYKRFRFF